MFVSWHNLVPNASQAQLKSSPRLLVLRRVQAVGAGAEGDVHPIRIVRELFSSSVAVDVSPRQSSRVCADSRRRLLRLPLYCVLTVDDSGESAIGASKDEPCWLDGTTILTAPFTPQHASASRLRLRFRFENISISRTDRFMAVAYVICSAGAGGGGSARGPGETFKFHSSTSLPDSVTNDATGRLTLPLGGGRSGRGLARCLPLPFQQAARRHGTAEGEVIANCLL